MDLQVVVLSTVHICTFVAIAMTYLAIDPGGTTGWALFNDQGEVTGIGKIKGHDDFLDWLEEQTPDTVILENYKVGRSGNQFTNSFSDVPTLQLIGAIKRHIRKNKITLIEQSPNDMYMGLKYLGLYSLYRGGKTARHVPDEQSALAHGTYYLVKTGIKPHRLDRNNEDLD